MTTKKDGNNTPNEASSSGAKGKHDANEQADTVDPKKVDQPQQGEQTTSQQTPQSTVSTNQQTSAQSTPPEQPVTAGQLPKKRNLVSFIALTTSVITLGLVGAIAYIDYDVGYYLKHEGTKFNPELAASTAVDQLDKKVGGDIQQIKNVSRQSQQQLQQLVNKQQQQTQSVRNQANDLSESLSNLRQQFNQMQGTSRDDWQLAEVEYMLRLANQRLLTEKDANGVEAILASADKILAGLDNYSLYPVREALAKDLVAVRAIPSIDLEGLYLQLSALEGAITRLPLIPPAGYEPEAPAQVAAINEESGEKGILEHAKSRIEGLWNGFTQYFRFSTDRDKPVELLLTPNEELYLRHNLRLMLEQAQLALLQGQQEIYLNSLSKAELWIKTYFSLSNRDAESMLGQLDELQDVKLTQKMPDISGSLKAIKAYIDNLHRYHEGKLPKNKSDSDTSAEASNSNALMSEVQRTLN
ncbi:uroporphyrinogen-III C-methyltransferase [Zooshikella harenae]|uniref:Uroporphyrinogen-III C-methyltransferase n=1 Tax=Zooshikella harenae TaxID=2827238 RepID=A0ABS5Z6T8_9GAMM|nr:uroporphyrinogen-III C-methyltransferase [Zooshikella harenae]MBU2709473.1 uroporphyrinogen-III C-methyltransferase [Zooshikella harenae]